jgi:hypothetical protein
VPPRFLPSFSVIRSGCRKNTLYIRTLVALAAFVVCGALTSILILQPKRSTVVGAAPFSSPLSSESDGNSPNSSNSPALSDYRVSTSACTQHSLQYYSLYYRETGRGHVFGRINAASLRGRLCERFAGWGLGRLPYHARRQERGYWDEGVGRGCASLAIPVCHNS